MKDFFCNPVNRKQVLYEALRMCFLEHLSDKETCERFGLKYNTFRSIKQACLEQIKMQQDPAQLFFLESKRGKREKKQDELTHKILTLRDNNMSVPDIKAILSSEKIQISFWKIHRILKQHHLPRLQRRTNVEKDRLEIPEEFLHQQAESLPFTEKEKYDSQNGSIFLFLPILQTLRIDKLVKEAGYPQTRHISSLQAVLSYVALKLLNTKRLEHSNEHGLDRGLGLFAGLNVLPKNAWFSSYSYRVSREMNTRLLAALHKRVERLVPGSGDINMDFTSIPHWGDESVLENNWSGTRGKGLKSIMAVLAQDQQNHLLKYGNAEITHKTQNDAVLEFIDFYKENKGKINCLIFDSKFTTYSNLNKLNKDGIRFLTLRRRSENIMGNVLKKEKETWKKINLNMQFKRKHRRLRAYEEMIRLKDYEGELRQICIVSQARALPYFLITNDFDISLHDVVLKYARRWLVEQNISEQVSFFHLNRLNSSIIIKVDFDLTMSILAETIYRLFALQFAGFEKVKSEKIYRGFIKNYAQFSVDGNTVDIRLNKKRHLALLLDKDWFVKGMNICWFKKLKVNFQIGTSL